MMVRILLATIVLASMMTTTAAADEVNIPFVDLEAPIIDEAMKELGEETDVDGPALLEKTPVQDPSASVDGFTLLLPEHLLSYMPMPETERLPEEIGGEAFGEQIVLLSVCNDNGVLFLTGDGVGVRPSTSYPYGGYIVTPYVGGNQRSWAYCP